LEISGRGFNWSFERKYRSGVTFNGPLGHNWEFNYSRRLVEVNSANLAQVKGTFTNARPGDLIRMDGFGRADPYPRNSDGSFGSPTGFYTGLDKNPDGSFTERDSSGTKVFYSKPNGSGLASMTSTSDRNGNTMHFKYNSKRQLVEVIDTLGRPIRYLYNSDGGAKGGEVGSDGGAKGGGVGSDGGAKGGGVGSDGGANGGACVGGGAVIISLAIHILSVLDSNILVLFSAFLYPCFFTSTSATSMGYRFVNSATPFLFDFCVSLLPKYESSTSASAKSWLVT